MVYRFSQVCQEREGQREREREIERQRERELERDCVRLAGSRKE